MINIQNADDNIALNGVCSDTEILQIITQQELQKLTKTLESDLKDIEFPIKIGHVHKIEKEFHQN